MAKSKISRKNGKGAIVGIALGAVALSGVAFSAWILTGQTPDTANISVSVGTVEDHRLKISGADVTGGLVFDCDASDTSGPIIYDSSDKLGGEKMSFKVSFYIEGALKDGQFAGYFNGFKVSLGYMNADGNASMSAGNKGMASAITSNWIVPPVTIGDQTGATISSLPTISDGSIASSEIVVGTGATLSAVYSNVTAGDTGYVVATDVKVTLTVSFAWGSAFSGSNPGAFASEGMSESSLQSIMSALESLHTASGAGLSITLTPLAK